MITVGFPGAPTGVYVQVAASEGFSVPCFHPAFTIPGLANETMRTYSFPSTLLYEGYYHIKM
jgi:hypothetical protein